MVWTNVKAMYVLWWADNYFIFFQNAYPFKSKPRGRALIIYNVNFDAEDSDMNGVENDAKNMKTLLENLMFEVECHKNKKAQVRQSRFMFPYVQMSHRCEFYLYTPSLHKSLLLIMIIWGNCTARAGIVSNKSPFTALSNPLNRYVSFNE